MYDGFLTDTRVLVFSELAALDERFRALSSRTQPSPKLWADAYLAAHAAANEATLVTFDASFVMYGIDCLVLEAE